MVARREWERGQSIVELAIFLPIVIVIFLGIADLARAFTSMIAVESAAREAADWGAYRPGNWSSSTGSCGQAQYICSEQEMERRACTATLSLTDYLGAPDGASCSNPTFECTIGTGSLGACGNPTTCDVDACRVRVLLTFQFDTIVPGGLLGLPTSFTFERDSIFAVGKDPGVTP